MWGLGCKLTLCVFLNPEEQQKNHLLAQKLCSRRCIYCLLSSLSYLLKPKTTQSLRMCMLSVGNIYHHSQSSTNAATLLVQPNRPAWRLLMLPASLYRKWCVGWPAVHSLTTVYKPERINRSCVIEAITSDPLLNYHNRSTTDLLQHR